MTLLLALAVASGGCPPCENEGIPEVFYDDLQEVCDGPLPCEWAVEAGAARTVATIHEAERGLRLDAGTTVSRPLPDLPLSDDEAAQLGVGLLARCDAPSDVLQASVVVQDAGGSHLYRGVLAFNPNSRLYLAPVFVELPLDEPLAPGSIATELLLETPSIGGCTVDELRLANGVARSCF